jgi:hypothetical protein
MNIYKAKNNKLKMTATTLRMSYNQSRKLNASPKRISPQPPTTQVITPSPSPQPVILKKSNSENLILNEKNVDTQEPKKPIFNQYPLMPQFYQEQHEQQPIQRLKQISASNNESETTPLPPKKKHVGVIVMDRAEFSKKLDQSKTNEGKFYDYSSEEEDIARTRKVYQNVINLLPNL